MSTEHIERLLRDNPALYKAMMEQVATEKSLYKFVELFWPFVEPANPFIGGWVIQVMCDHLEAVTRGEITRLLINVPPGFMKSLLVDCFWPAWEWIENPHMRYVCTSYSSGLTERDNGRFRLIVQSDLYQAMWGDKFKLTRDSVIKIENNKTGWKLATSTEGIGTGERGNRIIMDDLHNVREGESDAVMKSTLQYFTEVLPTRVTDPKTSAFIAIMQRVAELDVSGYIIANQIGYDHLCLPMEYDAQFPKIPTSIGFVDPRTEEGELLFPARFPSWVVERDKKIMGPYATAAQFQQRPSPRGGGIIKRDWWKYWPEDDAGAMAEMTDDDGQPAKKLEYPADMDFVIASIDTAFRKDGDGDYNALCILGLWRQRGLPRIMLMHAWQKRLDFRGEIIPKLPDETDKEYRKRRMKGWGMLEWTAFECQRFKVDKLLIEDKATGITLSQEIRKVYRDERWGTQLITPRGDKVARAYSVQHLWAEGMIYAPDRDWAELAISEMEKFPKGAHDDIPDCVFQGVRYLRDSGWALRRDEVKAEEDSRNKYRSKNEPLYPA